MVKIPLQANMRGIPAYASEPANIDTRLAAG